MSDSPSNTPPASSFAELGLLPSLLRALSQMEHHEPTPVQAEAIPAILAGGDVWASARTGSGKTAAFVLPLLQNLNGPRRGLRPTRALVVAPTRELALQIGQAIADYGQHLIDPPKCVVAVGGVSINPQMLTLRGGADIVVGTPGRLLDLVDHNALRLDQVETFVLDEADRLLSLGFSEELAGVCALLPEHRQNLMFSATFPAPVRALADLILNNATPINIDAGGTPDLSTIAQRAIEVDANKRTLLLRHLLREEDWSHVLVFVATKHAAEQMADKMFRSGIKAAPLHGELSQSARSQALVDFKAKRLQVLVATDLAARGLDIVQLPAVINFDLPRSAVDYLHRIGRTGRAGEVGVAISFVSAATESHFRLIEKRHGLEVPRERISGFEPADTFVPPGDPHGGIKGHRKSKKDKLREAAARVPKG